MNKLFKISLLLFFAVMVFACEEGDVDEKVCPTPTIEFEKATGLDIKVVAEEIPGATEYIWEVKGELSNGIFPGDDGSPNVISWGPRVGETEFCLTVKMPDCPEGVQVCKTFTRTQEEVDAENDIKCVKPILEFIDEDGKDLKVIAEEISGATEYIWQVKDDVLDGIYPSDAGNPNILTWGPREGETTFCLTVKIEECPEGVQTCMTYTNPESGSDSDSCAKPEFRFEKAKGLDIKVVAEEIPGATEYIWEVKGELSNGIFPGDDGSPHVLSWGPGEGETTFCLTVKTEECPEGVQTCMTYTNPESGSDSDSCAKPEFRFEKAKGLDIKVVAEKIPGATEYIWQVKDGLVDDIYSSDDGSPNVISWGPRVGETTFCLTVKTEECPEGVQTCQTFTRTQEEVDNENGK